MQQHNKENYLSLDVINIIYRALVSCSLQNSSNLRPASSRHSRPRSRSMRSGDLTSTSRHGCGGSLQLSDAGGLGAGNGGASGYGHICSVRTTGRA